MRFLIPLRFIRNDNLFFQNLLHPMRFLIPLRFIRNDKRLLKNGVVMAVRSANRHHYPCSPSLPCHPERKRGISLSHVCILHPFHTGRKRGISLSHVCILHPFHPERKRGISVSHVFIF